MHHVDYAPDMLDVGIGAQQQHIVWYGMVAAVVGLCLKTVTGCLIAWNSLHLSAWSVCYCTAPCSIALQELLPMDILT